jgi:uncharacterized protein (TIGR02145 family)
MKNILLILIFIFATCSVFAQRIYTRNDTIPITQDSVTIKAGLHRGTIQWQKSLDNTNWIDMQGEATDSLRVKPDIEALYRAKVTEGTCLPIYSDTASIIFSKPIVTTLPVTFILSTSAMLNGAVISNGGNEIIEEGFYISEKIDSITNGVKVRLTNNSLNFDTLYSIFKSETVYYVCTYATSKLGTTLGNTISFKTEELKLLIIETKGESEWDYYVTSKDSSYLFINMENDRPVSVFIKPDLDKDGFFIFLDEYGLPNKLVVDNHIVLFNNFRDSLVDVSVISPSGEIEIFRNLSSELDLSLFYLKTHQLAEGTLTPFIIKTLGHAVRVASCAASISLMPTGIGAVVTGITCANAFVQLMADAIPEDKNFQVVANGAKVVGALTSYGGCVLLDPTSCLTIAESALLLQAYEMSKTIENRNNEISAAQNLLRLPTISTSIITEITQTTANSGGNITSEGNSPIKERGVCWNTTGSPTPADNHTFNLSVTGSFTANLTGLIANTTYYVRAYATNSAGTAYGKQESFTTISEENLTGTFTDSRDGHTYKWVKIGTQVWMAENLAYLPSVSPPSSGSETIPYYYVYGYKGSSVADAKNSANYITYGVLYNWPAAMDGATSSNSIPSGVKGICPQGWHLPSKNEFMVLANFLGGQSAAGGKMKEIGTTHWSSPNSGANNESGFSALPSGVRMPQGYYTYLGSVGHFWTSTLDDYTEATFFGLESNSSGLASGATYQGNQAGMGIRCIKD